MSNAVRSVLAYYEELGLLEPLEWAPHIPFCQLTRGNYLCQNAQAQVTQPLTQWSVLLNLRGPIQDCMLRLAFRFDWVLAVDIDELLRGPDLDQSLPSLAEGLGEPGIGSLTFRSLLSNALIINLGLGPCPRFA